MTKSLEALQQEERSATCPDCNGEIDLNNGEQFCKQCGLVIE